MTTAQTGIGRMGLLYVTGMVAYSAFRAWAVSKGLGEYGVNPVVFFVFDAGSAVPLAVGQVKILQGLRRRNPPDVQRWSIIAGLAFLSPYAYLVLGGNKPLPKVAYGVIALVVVGSAAATVWRIRSERRALEEARRAELASEARGELP